MSYKNSIKKIVAGLVVLIILAFVVAIITSFFVKNKPKQETGDKTQSGESISKTNVNVTENPDKFPEGLPVEENAKVTQNYNATTKDGRFQATKVFETTKSLAQNYVIYQDYMKANGWEIKNSLDNVDYKMIYATKGGASLQVSMDNNTNSNVKTINISYTETSQRK